MHMYTLIVLLKKLSLQIENVTDILWTKWGSKELL